MRPDGATSAQHLEALSASLEGLRWRLPLCFAALTLLGAMLLQVAEAFDLLSPGIAGAAVLVVIAAAALSGLLLLVASALIWRPIRQAFDEAVSLQLQADARCEQRARLDQLSERLQQAQSPVELANSLLSELARCLPLHQALCCFWDEEGAALEAVARYGGEGTDAAAIAADPRLGALLHEVARQRRPVAIEHPGAGFLRVSSGLGDAEPAELLLYPFEHRGRLFAVLELASLQPLGEAARQLLDEATPLFAICLDLLQRSARSERLLEQARAAEAHTRLILNAVGDGIWGMDSEGRVTFVNPVALAMLGWSEEEVMGRSSHALLHHHRSDGSDYPQAECPMHQTQIDGRSRRVVDEVLWRKDGRPLPVEYVTNPVRRGDAIVGIVVVCRERAAPAEAPG